VSPAPAARARETFDAVIVGAGVQGASTAYHLARAGLRVLILERRSQASGATGRSSGLVRMHYDVAAEAALAWASFPYFRDWAELVGGDCGFVRTGFVRIVERGSEAALAANVAALQALGVPTLTIGADDVRRLAPAFETGDLGLAAYEPESGHADPSSTCGSLIAAARRLGAEFRPGTPVLRIAVEGGRVAGVESPDGRVDCPVVVDAAGVRAGEIGALVGLDVPIRVWHHHTGFVERPDPLLTRHPAVIDDINAMYLRPEGRDLTLVGLEDGNVIDDRPDDEAVGGDSFVERAVERICRRIPALAEGRLRSTHGGVDGITPDQHPILGPAGPDGFYLQCGFSGTGFKTAPATGACLAELIVEGAARTADIGIFGLGRFAEGRPIVSDYPYPPAWR
jgi:sarcosine oxidase subunit beta